ncbi:MAG: Poly(3-hydroxyalkanoate) polymerase subunit PhaC [Gammaproteobacteria bacterium]|nr:Poly(3-hydroxyalkanoate) polymerase subunit PhaC [Gammaproteobacteria bacterium]
MSDSSLKSAAINEELSEFARKLGAGFETLKKLDGLDSGVTPRDAIYEEDKLKLFHYKSPSGKHPIQPVPLLIVYALVNRPYMTDLQPDRSLIRSLLDKGLDVYLIDWGYPDRSDRCLTMDDYINGYLDRCVDIVRRRHDRDNINILGICQGGSFSVCYASLHPDKVKNLITMVTPVDFQTADNMLSHWTRDVDVDLLVDTLGNVPGELLNWTFLALKPFQLMGRKYVDMVDALADETSARNFMRMEKWIFDSPDQAGETFREFVKIFFQGNGFVNGTARVGSTPIDLNNLTMPLLNVYAGQDHLVPPDASRALRDLTGTGDYTELEFDGGHIGIYVSSKARKTVPPTIAEWLAERA